MRCYHSWSDLYHFDKLGLGDQVCDDDIAWNNNEVLDYRQKWHLILCARQVWKREKSKGIILNKKKVWCPCFECQPISSKAQASCTCWFLFINPKRATHNCSRRHFDFCSFQKNNLKLGIPCELSSKQYDLAFHVNRLPSRRFTWNAKSYLLWKNNKTKRLMSSATILLSVLSI